MVKKGRRRKGATMAGSRLAYDDTTQEKKKGKKRGHLVKGSAAAKAWGAKMRALRKKK